MKKMNIPIIVLILLNVVSCSDPNIWNIPNHAKTELKTGFPDFSNLSAINKYKDPYFAKVESSQIFDEIYFTLDLSDSSNNYYLLTSDNKYTLGYPRNLRYTRNNLLLDTISVELNNANLSTTKLELLFDRNEKHLYYAWVNATTFDNDNPAGRPVLIKRKLQIGDSSPDFQVKLTNGSILQLSNLKGKYVFIDFWGTWCGGCIYSLPFLKELRDNITEDDLFMVGLAKDDEKELLNFISKSPINYPVAVLPDSVIHSFGIEGYPSYFLIDKTGRISRMNFNGISFTKAIRESINKAL